MKSFGEASLFACKLLSRQVYLWWKVWSNTLRLKELRHLISFFSASEGDISLVEFNSLKTNRSFATSHSQGTKPPCWRATDAVRQANKHHVNDKLQRACYGGEASSSQSGNCCKLHTFLILFICNFICFAVNVALCTEWPGSLDLSSVPLRITTRNYLFAGPSLYHPGSRKVKLQVL